MALTGDRPRALVLRALGLGDLLTAVPALRGIRRALPHHEIVVAAPQALRPLVSRIGGIDALRDTPDLQAVTTFGAHVDLAINLHGRGRDSHRALLELEPDELVAFACPRLCVPGPTWAPNEHEVHRWCRLVEESFGTSCDRTDLRLQVPGAGSEEADPFIVIHPGAAFTSRRWPTERFAALAQRLNDLGHDIRLTGSASEAPTAHHIAATANLPRESVLAGHTDLEQLTRVTAAARLVISGDTGLAHLAVATATPSITLFGPISPRLWGPPLHPHHATIWTGDPDGDPRPGDPWGDLVDPRLLEISVDDVWEHCLRLLVTSEADTSANA